MLTCICALACILTSPLFCMKADDPAAVEGRRFIQENGGATYTSSWAKLWLCVLGVMEWEGHNSVPVELWLLPKWFPFHPTRLWCHCRMVYLPMGYLHCSRFVYPQVSSALATGTFAASVVSCACFVFACTRYLPYQNKKVICISPCSHSSFPCIVALHHDT